MMRWKLRGRCVFRAWQGPILSVFFFPWFSWRLTETHKHRVKNSYRISWWFCNSKPRLITNWDKNLIFALASAFTLLSNRCPNSWILEAPNLKRKVLCNTSLALVSHSDVCLFWGEGRLTIISLDLNSDPSQTRIYSYCLLPNWCHLQLFKFLMQLNLKGCWPWLRPCWSSEYEG